MRIKESRMRVIGTFSSIYIACFGYIFMEWLFFLTKPSILSYYNNLEKVSTLFLLPLVLFVCLIPLSAVLLLVDEYLWKRKKYPFITIVSAFIYSSLIFLLVENFTNTVFGFFSGSLYGIGRYFYLVFFLTLLIFIYRRLSGISADKKEKINIETIAFSALSITIGTIFLFSSRIEVFNSKEQFEISNSPGLPNILILSSDGINKSNMSVYGYERETTPFIDSLYSKSLVSLNHFANSAHTASSVISLLTGKLPVTTKLIYPPDILNGVDSYQHLPGILKNLGYSNADISVRYYADAGDLNLVDGFDYANGRRVLDSKLGGFFQLVLSEYPAEYTFLKQSLDRLLSRLLHFAGIVDLEDVYSLVNSEVNLSRAVTVDRFRIRQLEDFIEKEEGPFFVHLHLMATHGPKFFPPNPVFSRGQEQTENHMRDFYDDSIINFDDIVRSIYSFLDGHGVLENTLIIINSDHSRRPNAGKPVPLLMHFPKNLYAGEIEQNTQRLDIAPTILDFIGVPIPEWMEGESILSLGNEDRLIFSYQAHTLEMVEGLGWSVRAQEPPFFTLNNIFVIDCNRLFAARISEESFRERIIDSHSGSCSSQRVRSASEISQAIRENLYARGYDVSSLGWLTDSYDRNGQFFSLSRPTLSGDLLFIPSIKFQNKSYSALLERMDDGYFELVDHRSLPESSVGITLNESNPSFVLKDVDVDGVSGLLEVTLIRKSPPRFDINFQ